MQISLNVTLLFPSKLSTIEQENCISSSGLVVVGGAGGEEASLEKVGIFTIAMEMLHL